MSVFSDEYQKVVRGIVSNEALDTIINELETTGVEGVNLNYLKSKISYY